jgi:hypothetical protein
MRCWANEIEQPVQHRCDRRTYDENLEHPGQPTVRLKCLDGNEQNRSGNTDGADVNYQEKSNQHLGGQRGPLSLRPVQRTNRRPYALLSSASRPNEPGP